MNGSKITFFLFFGFHPKPYYTVYTSVYPGMRISGSAYLIFRTVTIRNRFWQLVKTESKEPMLDMLTVNYKHHKLGVGSLAILDILHLLLFSVFTHVCQYIKSMKKFSNINFYCIGERKKTIFVKYFRDNFHF